jgi:hypothetical protein
MDLIYDIKHDDRTWNEKLFSQSRGRMYKDDRDWQLLFSFVEKIRINCAPERTCEP